MRAGIVGPDPFDPLSTREEGATISVAGSTLGIGIQLVVLDPTGKDFESMVAFMNQEEAIDLIRRLAGAIEEARRVGEAISELTGWNPPLPGPTGGA